MKDFLYIEDFVEAVIKLIKIDTGEFNVFNIASGKNITIRNLLRKLLVINKMKKWKVSFDKTKPSLIPVRKINISKVKKFINWKPRTSFDKGLKLTLNWYNQNK